MGEILDYNTRRAFEICGYTSVDGYFTATECNYIYIIVLPSKQLWIRIITQKYYILF